MGGVLRCKDNLAEVRQRHIFHATKNKAKQWREPIWQQDKNEDTNFSFQSITVYFQKECGWNLLMHYNYYL